MFNVFILFGLLIMPQQVGCQSGGRTAIHNHMNISQGGIICIEERSVGAAVSINNLVPKVRVGIGAFTLVKEITIQEDSAGVCTVYYDLERTGGAGAVHAQLYVNDVAVGVDNLANPGPTNFNDVLVLDLVVGDRIQIYAYTIGANEVTVSNMIIQYSNSLRSVASHSLVAVLPTTYAVPIQTYNSMV